MTRCGYVNPRASGLIRWTIEEKLREYEEIVELAGRQVSAREEAASDLCAEIKRILDVECDIEWTD